MKRKRKITAPENLNEEHIGERIKNMDQILNTIPENTVLTNDPSMTAWGWAVLDYSGNVIQTGCIKTETEGKKRRIRKSDETSQRISEINNTLLKVIKQHNVNYILTESPHGSQSASAAVMVGAVSAIVQTISDCLSIGVEWYSEWDSKKCLLGKSSATKMETMLAIDKLYKVPVTKGISKNKKGGINALWSGVAYVDEAVADALAVHYVATKQSNMLKMMRK